VEFVAGEDGVHEAASKKMAGIARTMSKTAVAILAGHAHAMHHRRDEGSG
jgi:hypothetical protein